MHGTRDVAQNWSEKYTQKPMAAGYSRGITSPCSFYSSETGVSMMVHGDDFIVVGQRPAPNTFRRSCKRLTRSSHG